MGLHQALQAFAAAATAKTGLRPGGGAEEQLRGPFENFVAAAGAVLGRELACAGEAALPDRLGRSDFAIHDRGALLGYAELKAPGAGADAGRFRGRDRAQFRRFAAIPNLLYSDGSHWALYRGGERIGKVVKLSGDAARDGADAVGEEDARALEDLLRDFLSWTPILPLDRRGRVDLKAFAELMAPLCRMLREDVAEALRAAGSPMPAGTGPRTLRGPGFDKLHSDLALKKIGVSRRSMFPWRAVMDLRRMHPFMNRAPTQRMLERRGLLLRVSTGRITSPATAVGHVPQRL